MDFTQLTEKQHNSFNQDGFLVVPNAIDAEKVHEITEITDYKARDFLNKSAVPLRAEYNQLDLRPGILTETATINLVTCSSTVPLVVQLLSPNIQLHSTAIVYKRPSDPHIKVMRRGWHRDIRFPGDLGFNNLPRFSIKVCYCLTDFHDDDDGLTLLARGTQLRNKPLEICKGKADPNDVEICDLKLNAGDAFLFDNRTFHTASPNRTSRVSKVIIFGYAFRWMRTEVYLENPDPNTLRNYDPITRQLLGEYVDIDTPPWALQAWAKQNNVLPDPLHWHIETGDDHAS